MAECRIIQSPRRLAGGLQRADGKALSLSQPLMHMNPPVLQIALPDTLEDTPLERWSIGDQIEAGQPLFTTQEGVTQACPRTATVESMGTGKTLSGSPTPCRLLNLTVVDPDPPRQPSLTPLPANPDGRTLRQRAADAGIVGLGGGGFPAHLKWQHRLHTLIVNGAECEPFLTADEQTMRLRAPAIWDAVVALMSALSLQRCVLVLEDNKPEALAALQAAYPSILDAQDVCITVIQSQYPSGAERQLIWLALGLEIATTTFPVEHGIVVHNPVTLAALADALHGYPLTDRIVTVTGPSIVTPGTFQTPLGTPIDLLLSQAGGLRPRHHNVFHGGPYTGWPISNTAAGVRATTACLYAAPVVSQTPSPCIRCGACAEVCPVQLQPQQLFAALTHDQLDEALHVGLSQCLECGACDVVCPSNLSLTKTFQDGIRDHQIQQAEKQRADRARTRFEARNQRLLKRSEADETRRAVRRERSGSALDRIRAARAEETH